MGEGIVTVRKNYCTHSDRGPTGEQVNVACQKRILRGAVRTTIPQPPVLCCPM